MNLSSDRRNVMADKMWIYKTPCLQKIYFPISLANCTVKKNTAHKLQNGTLNEDLGEDWQIIMFPQYCHLTI